MSEDTSSRPSLTVNAAGPDAMTTVPVIAERAVIDKQLVEVARTVLTKTVSEEAQTLETLLSQDHVHVERVPVNVYVDVAPPVRVEGDTTISPVGGRPLRSKPTSDRRGCHRRRRG